MTAGERFTQWVDNTASRFADRLSTWGMGLLARGGTKMLEDMEPGAIESMKETLKKVRDDPNTPDDLKHLIDKVITPGNPLVIILGVLFLLLTISGTLGALFAPINKATEMKVDRGVESFRLDPLSIIMAWRRDKEKYAWLLDDLEEKGWSDERIEALKFFTEIYPTPRDYVGFLAHEVFEPDMVSKYGLLSEWGKIDKEPAKKIGLMEDQLQLYWMDHWKHPEWGTIRELRHRDQITDQDVKDWFRLVEIPEYWRPKMLNVLWSMPNRIEIRMMARYLDLSKADIEDLLKKAGLHEDFRSDAADFMMIMGLTGYWGDMLRKGWMSPAEVKADIDARGFKPITAERLYKRLVSADQPERTAAERDLTKTDIYKGVKTGVISRGEAEELLVDLGFTGDEAIYLLDINIPRDEEDEVVAERQLTKTDILKGLKTEVITRGEARTRLLGLRYSPADAEFLLKIFDAQVKPPTEAREREASKADILLGVKKGLITPEEGYGMLLDLGFTPEAADFILMVKAEESPFSPIDFAEFKDLTQKYRIAAGKE